MTDSLRRAALWEAALAWERDGRRARSLWPAPQLAALGDLRPAAALPAAFLARSRARVRLRRALTRALLALLVAASLAGLVGLRRDAADDARRTRAAQGEAAALTLRWRAAEPELLLLRAQELDARGLSHEALVMTLAAHAAAREIGEGLAGTERAVAARRTQRPWQPEGGGREQLTASPSTQYAWGFGGDGVLVTSLDAFGAPTRWRVLDRGSGRVVRELRAFVSAERCGGPNVVIPPPAARLFLQSAPARGPARWALARGPLAAALLRDGSSYDPTAALSPDGRFAVTAYPGSPAARWDVATGRRLGALPIEASRAAFLGDGQRFVTLPGMELWETATGRLLRTLPSGEHTVSAAHAPVVSRDGRCLAAWTDDGWLSTWSTEDGAFTGAIDLRHGDASRAPEAHQVTFAGDSCDLLVAEDGRVEARWSTPASLDPDAPRDADGFTIWALLRTPLRVRRSDLQVVHEGRPPLHVSLGPWSQSAYAFTALR